MRNVQCASLRKMPTSRVLCGVTLNLPTTSHTTLTPTLTTASIRMSASTARSTRMVSVRSTSLSAPSIRNASFRTATVTRSVVASIRIARGSNLWIKFWWNLEFQRSQGPRRAIHLFLCSQGVVNWVYSYSWNSCGCLLDLCSVKTNQEAVAAVKLLLYSRSKVEILLNWMLATWHIALQFHEMKRKQLGENAWVRI